ncbi:hypothetical protein SAMN05216474_0613 [Lishizhenia tianjinensis]|uniref:Uncharacterized protein n=1 Tax=Lishizhenia tianjinensis TaxID=477690 RepID=A0A1I6Y1W9_9FLAO|nr:hypothetical protein [Lishizhenia tianjinensis]SFT44615.1 hypothetical protein SAMN05216474_0613 [Lishizhenia tianjinensis]
MKTTLLRIHLVAWGLALLNWISCKSFAFSLHQHLELGVEISVFLSGLALFFYHLKPFKKFSYYFSIYPFIVVVFGIGALTKNLFLFLIVYIFLFPLQNDVEEYRENEFALKLTSDGLMDMCCSYKLVENKFYLFEKVHLQKFYEGEITPFSIENNIYKKELYMRFTNNAGDTLGESVYY